MTKLGLAWDKTRACLLRDVVLELGSVWSFGLQLAHLAFAVVSYYFFAVQLRSAELGGYPAFGFLLIGIMVQGYMTTVLVTFAQIIQNHQAAGTLKAVMTTRTTPVGFMMLSSVFPLCRAAIDVTAYLIVGWILGWSFGDANLSGAALTFALSLVAFGSAGLMLATLSLFSSRTHAAVTALVGASWLLSGGLYPSHVLPAWLQHVAPWLPATHAIAAFRATLLGSAPTEAILPQLGALALFALVAVPASVLTFEAGLRRARVYGTLARN